MLRRSLRIVIAIFLAGFPLLAFAPSAQAINGNLRQQILPLECIFQVVNDGSNTIIYITPDECGVVVPPDPVDPIDPIEPIPTIPGVEGTPTTPTRLPSRIVQTEEAVSEETASLGSESARLLPFRPVTSNLTPEAAAIQREEILAAMPGAAVIVTITALGLVVLVSII